MGSVRRDPRNAKQWQARYRDPGGRQRTKTFPTKADARAFLGLVDHEVRNDTWIDPASGRLTLDEYAEKWWASVVNLRPSTRARDEATWRNHIQPVFGHRPLSSIEHEEIRSWVAQLTASGRAPATVVKAHQVLAKMLRGAVDAKRIRHSPADGVPLPRVEHEEMRILTVDEITAVADLVAPRYRALVLLGCYGGLRIGEMAGLRRDKVDLLRREVRVAEIAVEVHGTIHLGAPKTRAGRRTVPLARVAADALETHLGSFGSADPSSFVFTGRDGGVLRTNAWRARHWVPAVVEAGLGTRTKDETGRKHFEGVRPHDMRHTAVSLWIAAGATPKQVATWAGHTSVSVVLDRYGHLFPGHEAPVLDRLDALARPMVEIG
jgi:integrase